MQSGLPPNDPGFQSQLGPLKKKLVPPQKLKLYPFCENFDYLWHVGLSKKSDFRYHFFKNRLEELRGTELPEVLGAEVYRP